MVNGEFKDVSLADYKGKYVVLFFYPLDFTVREHRTHGADAHAHAHHTHLSCAALVVIHGDDLVHVPYASHPCSPCSVCVPN